jgi:hypothetical protein
MTSLPLFGAPRMSRLAPLLLLALAPPALAQQGGAPAPPDPRSRSAAEFGLSPTATGEVNRKAIQAAHDAIPALKPDERGTVTLPPGSYDVMPPIFLDRSRINVEGAGRGRTTLRMPPYVSGSMFLVGMPRFTFDGAHAVDAFGKLDATAASRPGVRWALSNLGTDWIVLGGSPWMSGPPGGWPTVSTAVLEFAWEGPLAPGLGLGASAKGKGRPVLVYSQAEACGVYCGIDTGLAEPEAGFGVQFPSLAALPPGKHVGVLQINLGDADEPVRLWVDGQRSEPFNRPKFPAGSHLGRNRETPWKIGPPSERGSASKSDYYANPATPASWTLLGARVSAGVLRYKLDANLARLDGARITDRDTLFDAQGVPGCVAALALTDDPAIVAETRRVTSIDGRTGWRNIGSWASPKHEDSFTFIDGVSLKGLTLNANPYSQPVGEALTLGSVTSFSADDCDFKGGSAGVSTWNWGVGYVDRFRRCTFGGANAAIYNYMRQQEIADADFAPAGRSCVVNRMGHLRGRNWMISAGTPTATETFVEGWAGAANFLEALDLDNEDTKLPLVAQFLAEPGINGASAGRIVLRDVALGVGGDKPIVRLLRRGLDRAATVTIDGLDFYGSPKCVLDSPGGWDGSVSGVPAMPGGMPMVTGEGAAGIVTGAAKAKEGGE